MNLPNCHSTFWTDSTAVLQMIVNTNKRFPVFVSNRLTKIEENTSTNQWRYIPSKDNPDDLASQGTDPETFVSKSYWLQRPKVLFMRENLWPEPPRALPSLPNEFLVLKRVSGAVSQVKKDFCMQTLFARYSNWHKLKKALLGFCV